MVTHLDLGRESRKGLPSTSLAFLFALRTVTSISVSLAMLVIAGCHKESPPTPPVEQVEQVSQRAVVVPTPQALLVVGATPLTGGDLALSNRLSTNLGFAVTTVTGSAATSTNANGKPVGVISEPVVATPVNTKFKAVPGPVRV